MIQIPAETIARHATLVRRAKDPNFQALRLESGMVISCDRKLLAIEQIVPQFEGTFHLRLSGDLVRQCETEAGLGGTVSIVPNDMLAYTTVKTSYGWSTQENLYVPVNGELGRWREVIAPCREPLNAPGVGSAMVWDAASIAALASVSPSGDVVFERIIDPNQRCTMMRDVTTADWVGFFLPQKQDGLYHAPAEMPGWLRVGE